jgi:7,8-dihydro-6-hydroxymethylpterin-pyrophosphokinase
VLGPLAELAPALMHPLARERIDDLWRRFDRGAHPLTPVALEGGEA